MMLLIPWVFNEWNYKIVAKKRGTVNLLFSCAEINNKGEEFNLSHLFKVPYDVLVNFYYVLSKDVHISWEGFNDMPWFWILMLIEEHKEFIEAQNNESGSSDDMLVNQQAQMEQMQRQQQQMMNSMKTPEIPNFNSFNYF